ncbi:MAG: hypothetical protein JSS12_03280 [Verrucomicrobia bacterium]|nr:hypothetical protein [Verrucomicrobiota bacterium]
MSGFIPGLTEEISNAWNWLTGASKQASESEEKEAISLPKEPLDESEVSESIPIQKHENWEKYSLAHALMTFINIEAMHKLEKRAQPSSIKAKEAYEKSTQLNNLLQTINTHSDAKGNFNAQDAETQEALKLAVSNGVKLELKKEYTKDERDSLITNIKTRTNTIDVDLKMAMNEMTEAVNQRNTLWQELKSCWDRIAEAVRKFIQAISGR